jgi:hypothetical protein
LGCASSKPAESEKEYSDPDSGFEFVGVRKTEYSKSNDKNNREPSTEITLFGLDGFERGRLQDRQEVVIIRAGNRNRVSTEYGTVLRSRSRHRAARASFVRGTGTARE